jgi:hypothetical protein
MTLFSCRKYNNFILIQEIFDKFWCECNGDKAALTAAAQASANALAQEKANAMECDCPQTWSANVVDYSESGSCINFTVEYSNPCGSSKTITVTGGAEANTSTGMEMTSSTTITIGTGSGYTSGKMCFQAGIRPGTAHAACTTGGQC